MPGPITTDTTVLAAGFAQIRIGDSATNISNTAAVLTSSDSIGAMAATKFMAPTEWLDHESGFPLKRDFTTVTKEEAKLECSFEEMSPYNIALAYGIDPTGGGYASAHSGEVALGGRCAPGYVRAEAVFTFPQCAITNNMIVIFPRAQIKSDVELDFQSESMANVPISIESTLADSNISGGSSAWDNMPLGRIEWD